MKLSNWDLASSGVCAKGELAGRRHFFEEALPAAARNIHYIYPPVAKREVVFEGKGKCPTSSFASSLVRLDDGAFRLYGTSYDPSFSSMGITVWDSSDGLRWVARELGQTKRDDGCGNFIRFSNLAGKQDFLGQPQVVRLSDGRWRMYFWKHRDGHVRYLVAESGDGLKWEVLDVHKPALYHPGDEGFNSAMLGLVTNKPGQRTFSKEEILTRKRLTSNDATFIYRNPESSLFECYSVWLHKAPPDRRVEADNCADAARLIQRRTSEDGLNWSDPEMVIMPDGKDPWDLQFYFLAVQRHADMMIGSLGHYRVEDGQQSMDIELCFSRDGRKWERPLRGGFIPRGSVGEMDCKGIYAPNAWIDKGKSWLCLYTGTPNAHNDTEHRIQIIGAEFAMDRLVGVQTGKLEGGFMSEPFILCGDEIEVDADIRGWLKVELCDAFGRKLEGFHLGDSSIIKGAGPHIPRWRSACVSSHRYECLCLRFEYQDGEIYSFKFK